MTQSEQSPPPTETAQSSPRKTWTTQPSSIAEWISFAIAATVLAMVIGLVILLWASDRQRQPPILQVEQAAIRQSQDQFYVPFAVTNAGGKSAESVQVVAELRVDGVPVESGEQILEFLSSQETTRGAFVFTQNPQNGTLVIRVASYQAP